jgi:hypothetical protein
MRLSIAHLALIIGIPLAGAVGYWFGASSSQQGLATDTVSASKVTESVKTIGNDDYFDAGAGSSVKKKALTESKERSEAHKLETSATSNDSLEAALQQAKEFNYPLPEPDKDHIDERQNFSREYSDEDEDWQAKTHFTDFLLLHDDAHLIDLHKIICNSEKCQLIGKYDAEHENWGEIVKQMQQQEWWTYWGTSSSTTTRDGVTYFNLFVNKPK